MLFHEFAEDFVLAADLGFEGLDLLILDGFDSLRLPVGPLPLAAESGLAVLEELALPEVEEAGCDFVFFTQFGNGNFLEQVLSENGDLLLRVKALFA